MLTRYYEKSVFYGDFHAPYEDPWCSRIMEDFNKWFKPSKVFLVGDIIDFYALSKFDKNRHPEYVKSSNWQQGFTVGYFKKGDRRFAVDQICIPDGKCVYAGREFGKGVSI
jgi:hypothetical protein